jgi:hypothetical protein
MTNQQLEGPRNPNNSHLLIYFSIGIANKGQQHAKNKNPNMI